MPADPELANRCKKDRRHLPENSWSFSPVFFFLRIGFCLSQGVFNELDVRD
ncbi:hypothetical protein JCM10512_4921 [Bacteroides reticulotermitis JCM 10512]|uniref:Uncharacterized protein n=1 Tax=Bacteroides reticulotermitis JCM 10512 TaxID=1445607 RepID=W4UYT5_9BACE|nr:hypothetical protein JCM10512_4921 [Bacteroides reticulotermitis JCM 10512]